MDFSIVIPAYNEEHKIALDVSAASAFLTANSMAGEVIVVDDGSPDQTAERARSAPVDAGVVLKVIRLERNCGKGAAVKAGMTESQGEFVMFADSGLCVPFSYALEGIRLIRDGQCEIAHGSRRLPGTAILQPAALHRRVLSRAFRFATRAVMGLPRALTDTQCGFKVYRGDVARRVYAECTTPGFMFDIEVILRAHHHGYRIREFPIQWQCDRDTRLRTGRTAVSTIKELAHIRRTLRDEGEGLAAEGQA